MRLSKGWSAASQNPAVYHHPETQKPIKKTQRRGYCTRHLRPRKEAGKRGGIFLLVVVSRFLGESLLYCPHVLCQGTVGAAGSAGAVVAQDCEPGLE